MAYAALRDQMNSLSCIRVTFPYRPCVPYTSSVRDGFVNRGLSMARLESAFAEGLDPQLEQAEKIFAQRRARAFLFDPRLLGEPAWDLLLCSFIALRKGETFDLQTTARTLGLSIETGLRWACILEDRDLFVRNGSLFSISKKAEGKLGTLFEAQIKELAHQQGHPARVEANHH